MNAWSWQDGPGLDREPIGRGSRRLAGMVLGVLLVCVTHAGLAEAAEQRLVLRRDWNLIAFNVEPINPEVPVVFASLIQQNGFDSLWTFDAASGEWLVYPASGSHGTFDTVRTGVGYWLKVRSAPAGTISITVTGSPSLPQPPPALRPGWNLLGFVLDSATSYERVLSGLPVRQIWTFDAAPSARKFRGVVFGAAATAPVTEDFTRIEAGRGYWVLLGDVGEGEPELVTGLPPDVDLPPLLPEAGGDPSERLPFSELSPGDLDAGRDGMYDRPPGQRGIDFGDFSDLARLTVANRGPLSLSWRVRVEDPEATPWLRLRNPEEPLCRGDCPTELAGAVTTETAEIDVVADRSGFGPGAHFGRLLVESNGRPSDFPFEPARTVDVWMTVPPLDGDYEVGVTIDTVNGEEADLSNPTYFLSLYSDRDGLKGILDARRSLLLPEYCVGGTQAGTSCGEDGECPGGRCEHHVRLAGRMYAAGTNRFQISGSFELPESPDGQVGCANPATEESGAAPRDNPYDVPLRRDITLRGDRPLVGESTLGPQDLQGEYFETIRNVLGDPIQLHGTFIAHRRSPAPEAIDGATAGETPGQPVIPDGDPDGREFTKVIDENLLLSEVDVLVNISHPAPEDLAIALEAPNGEVAILRLRNHRGPVGELVYDETEQTPDPLHGLDQFVGDLSGGTWRLTVIDYDPRPDSRGLLREWELRLRGTRVNDVGGTVTGAPVGTRVVLTGCGHVYHTTTDTMGQYRFHNLIDCRYRVVIADPAYQSDPMLVSLQGSDQDAIDFAAAPTVEPGSPVTNCLSQSVPALCGPEDAQFRFASLTTTGGAGVVHDTNGTLLAAGLLRYMHDSAYFDLDRPPFNPGVNGCAASSPACTAPGGTCCAEDTNVWIRDPVTMQFSRGSNEEIDQPLDPTAGQRMAVTIGQPVIGVSQGGTVAIAIGANP